MAKTRVILIDAFKSSYLEYAPYLRSLCKQHQYGELDMGFGHWRGVDIIFNGKSDIIANFMKCDGKLSYFRYFVWLEKFGKTGRFFIDCLFNFPRWIRGYELFKTGNIPINILSKLDTSIKKHVAKHPDIDFTYFGELDNLGHKYGTKSDEIKEAVEDIDNKMKNLEFDLIFSDHGMVDISKTISVPITDDCFIDSDMARYWGSKEELADINKKLPMKHGKIIEWDKKYGDLIFLADTGVLIYPNFWNEKPVKGMHGYDGKHEDMKAFYLLNKNGSKINLKAEELHKILDEIRKRR